MKRRSPTTVVGVGCLIYNDMVITCAHNVYYEVIKYCRQEAHEVFVQIQGVGQIKVKKFRFPEEYGQTLMREYDFALLFLEKPVYFVKTDPKQFKFCLLAKDFEEDDKKIRLSHIRRQIPKTKARGMKAYEAQLDIKNKPVLEYELWTKKGDSGTPILIQSKGSVCYVIALHGSSKEVEDE